MILKYFSFMPKITGVTRLNGEASIYTTMSEYFTPYDSKYFFTTVHHFAFEQINTVTLLSL